MADDYSANISTTGRLTVGGSASGEFDTSYDGDWFRISLKAGVNYIFTLRGAASGDGTFAGTAGAYLNVNDGKGNATFGDFFSMYADGNSAVAQFMPSVGGDYFFSVSNNGNSLGSYTVSVTTPAPDDFADNARTTGTLQAGVATSAVFESAADTDWFRFHAEKGQLITFDADGVAGLWHGNNAARAVYDAAGVLQANVTNGPFVVTQSGDYFLSVKANSRLGAYTQTMQLITDDYAGDKTTTGQLAAGSQVSGTLDFYGDNDRFLMQMEAGQVYKLNLRLSSNDTSGISLAVYEPGNDYALLDFNPAADGTLEVYYLATQTGVYGVGVSGTVSNRPSYVLSASTGVADDFGGTRETAGALPLDVPLTGHLQSVRDVDMFKLDLKAGITYSFALDAGKAAIYISLYDNKGASVSSWFYGDKSYSYTPSQDGSYYLATDYNYRAFPGDLPYTLTASKAEDDYAANVSGAGRLLVGGTKKGTLESAGDRDWFAATLDADGYYWFTLAGEHENGGTLSSGNLRLMDASGKVVAATDLDPGSATAATLDFKAPARGVYYLDVSTSGGSGSYTVKAQLGVPDDYGNDASHAAAIVAGVPLKGALQMSGDKDVFKLNTVAGMSYIVELTPDATSDGSSAYAGAVDVSDSRQFGVNFRILGSSGNKTYGVFDADQGGDYYLDIQSSSYYQVNTGYTLSVRPGGADDYAANTGTRGVLEIARPLQGALHVSDDRDWIKVHLDAGRTYVFDLQGRYSGGGTLDTALASFSLLNAGGGSVATASIPGGGGGSDPRIKYVASVTGDFYLDVHNNYGASVDSVGTYTLSAVQTNLDTSGPRLLASSVAAGATGVAPVGKIVLTFDETVMAGGPITLTDSAGVVVAGNAGAQIVVAGNTITFDPHAYLTPGKSYILNLPQGSVLDLAGNAAAPRSLGFTVVAPVGSGTVGNDYFLGGGSVSLDGGAGVDTVYYDQAASRFTTTRNADGSVAVHHNVSGATDHLTNIERLQFSDGARALDIEGVGGQAYRMYQSAFNRTPDNAGLGLWISNMDQGMSLNQVAGYFIASDEFRQRYGAAPSDTDFVTLLYKNVLHRAPEAAGLAHWLDQLHGGLSRADTLVAFSESAENHANVATIIGNGFNYTPYGT
ncbi:DUF4214 domain-containing protein [Duganella callida]|uniref:DUF4214 domain-containing protein n=1 Tax=Duganella callida TaxID=2561932 RepID=A0A4Y9S180_9BURK|nr:DUF4214 domain-containing protein [Duganella callida]TFW13308.1 DUF4214 domain-containing protein [Duganella callida]